MKNIVNMILNRLKIRMADNINYSLDKYDLTEKEIEDIILRNYSVSSEDLRGDNNE